MIFEKATIQDISVLTHLRLAYIQEDLGTITDKDMSLMKTLLPAYYEKHLNKNLMIYVARKDDDIVSCAFLLIVEKPMSPAFITGKTGIVFNVYTNTAYRGKGYAKRLMKMMLEDAAKENINPIELKATDEGYKLYKSVGFEDVVSKYHTMKFEIK